MKRRAWVISLAIAGLSLSGAGWGQNYPASVTDMVAKARSQIKTIDMATFKAGLDRKTLGLIIDVREPAEYEEGHVPGAINIPRGQIEFKIWPHVGYPEKTDLAKKLTLYCSSGSRCTLAAKSLQELKFSNVTSVNMKFEDWRKAGHPIQMD